MKRYCKKNSAKQIIALLLVVLAFNIKTVYGQDGFPIPTGNANQLFYIQRTPNKNTIVYELNFKQDGTLDEEEPIHVVWIRYTEQGQRAELNYIQRKFAYGVKAKQLSKDKYEIRFVSYKKYPLYLSKASDNKYYVFATVNQKQMVLKRVFLKINGGSFWLPNVEDVELKGTDPATGKEVIEHMKV